MFKPKAKHRNPLSRTAAGRRWAAIAAAAVLFGGVAATTAASAAPAEQQRQRPHGSYTVVTYNLTDEFQREFTACWTEGAGLTQSEWDDINTSPTHAHTEAFYAAHPQARAAFKHCQQTIPVRYAPPVTEVVHY